MRLAARILFSLWASRITGSARHRRARRSGAGIVGPRERRRGGSAGAKPPGSRPLYGALREFCSRCKRRRIAVGAHGAPARSGAGHGAPASDEPGCGEEPTLARYAARSENFVLVVGEPHNGLGAPQARPPERSGDRGAPRAKAWGVRGGEAPRV